MWLRLVLILGKIENYFFTTKVVQGYNKDILSVEKEGAAMFALQGYYDGNAVQTMEKIRAQKNQKLIITILDEFIEEIPVHREKNQQEVCWRNMRIRHCGIKKKQHGRKR